MQSQLDRIETRLESLVENTLTSLMPWGTAPRDLVHELVAAMHGSLSRTGEGRLIAPGTYIIQVHPDRLPYWQADTGALEVVARHLSQAAGEEGIQFGSAPTLRLAANPALSTQGVQVIASAHKEPLADTAALRPAVDMERSVESIPADAFLIINGTQTFALRQAVVNIGRRRDNHLAIDDPRVSRTHAQLRAIHGRFVLFDLNSTGGTFVNGQRVTQINLNPGDVISLAGVPIIYGQEDNQTPPGPDSALPPGSTQSFPTPPTVFPNPRKP